MRHDPLLVIVIGLATLAFAAILLLALRQRRKKRNRWRRYFK